MPLAEHLRELRNRLMKAVLAILVVTIVALIYYKPIVDVPAPIPWPSPWAARRASACGRQDGETCAEITINGLIAPFTIMLKVVPHGRRGRGLARSGCTSSGASSPPGCTSTRRGTRAASSAPGVPLFLGGAYLAYLILPKAAETLLDFSPERHRQPDPAGRLPRHRHAARDRLRSRLRTAAAAGAAQLHRRPRRAPTARLVAGHGARHHDLLRRRHPHRRPADDGRAGRTDRAALLRRRGHLPLQRPPAAAGSDPYAGLDDDEASAIEHPRRPRRRRDRTGAACAARERERQQARPWPRRTDGYGDAT